MSNEVLLLASVVIDIIFIFCVVRLYPQRISALIVLNLILIAIFGSKMISIFGFTTNAGNVFYACAFLTTYFLLERSGPKQTYFVIWVGAGSVIVVTALAFVAVHLSGIPGQEYLNSAYATVFGVTIRTVCASLVSYIFAQFINIRLYSYFQTTFKHKYPFISANGANIVAQLIDSCIFFTIAFVDMSGFVLAQAIIAGWIIKSLVVFIGSPLLYLDRYLSRIYGNK